METSKPILLTPVMFISYLKSAIISLNLFVVLCYWAYAEVIIYQKNPTPKSFWTVSL